MSQTSLCLLDNLRSVSSPANLRIFNNTRPMPLQGTRILKIQLTCQQDRRVLRCTLRKIGYDLTSCSIKTDHILTTADEALMNALTYSAGIPCVFTLVQNKNTLIQEISDCGVGIPVDRINSLLLPGHTTRPGSIGFGFTLISTCCNTVEIFNCVDVTPTGVTIRIHHLLY